MSGNFLKNGNKVHFYMNTIMRRHLLPNSTVTPITRPLFHHPKASYARFAQTKAKEMEFSVPLASTIAKVKGVTRFSWISNSRVIGWYLEMLKTRPILTTCITSSIIYTAADFSSQAITRTSSEPYDFVRTFRMAGYGMIVSGPSLHFWFNSVFWLFPKRDLVSTLKKMLMGHTIYAPTMTAIFFSVNAGLQGESGLEIVARLKRDMIPALTNSIFFWSVCDYITLKFTPVPLQPLVSNSFVYLWTIYTTYMASLETAPTDL